MTEDITLASNHGDRLEQLVAAAEQLTSEAKQAANRVIAGAIDEDETARRLRARRDDAICEAVTAWELLDRPDWYEDRVMGLPRAQKWVTEAAADPDTDAEFRSLSESASGAPGTAVPLLHPQTGARIDEHLAQLVAFELRRQDAREIAALMLAERAWSPVPRIVTLREAISQAPESRPSRIESILPANGRAILIAPKKAGKSTVAANVVRAITTGEKMFDRWRARRGRVAVLNFEVLAEQWAQWCAEAGIPLDDSLVLSLRGQPNPLATKRGRTELESQLRDHDVDVLIVDPFGAASRGVVENENSSSDVRRFTGLLDELAINAGISELILPVHAGKMREDARGSSALEDWPDAIWTLVRNDRGDRFFYATGRDVEVAEAQLQFNPDNRRLSFTAGQANRASARYHAAADAIIDFLAVEPGATVTRVTDHLADSGHDVGKSGTVGNWLRDLQREGRIVQRKGERNAKANYLPDDAMEPWSCQGSVDTLL